MTQPHRLIVANALICLLVFALASCGPEKNSTQSTSVADAGSSVRSGLDFGEDWEQPRRDSGRGAAQRAAQEDERGRWTIVLGTFSGDNHAEIARAARQHIVSNAPELSSVRVHSTQRGSMLIYGRYREADDPRATADLARLKDTDINNMPIFVRAFLTPMPRQRADSSQAASRSEFDLLQVRERHPNVHPLYTLQVGLWGDFDSGRMSADEVRRQAESHARQLRSQNHEAYVHHDDRARQSIVTVGLFDRTALDASTGELGPEVRLLMRRFPVHLVNGEELHEPVDRRRPGREMRVQRPFLVIVPRAD